MRLLIIHNLYNSYIKNLYRENSNLATQNYATQLAKINTDSFAWCGVWEKPFEKLGWVVESIYGNVEPIQKAWLTEHNISGKITSDMVVSLQIEEFKPELIFVDDVFNFNNDWIDHVRGKFLFIKAIFGYVCSPSYVSDKITRFDLIFTCLESIRQELTDLQINVGFLPHAFNGEILERVANHPIKKEICFYGGFVRGGKGHGYRETVLTDIVKSKIEIDIYSDIVNLSFYKDFLTIKFKKLLYETFNFLKKVRIPTSILKKFPYYSRISSWEDFNSSAFDAQLKKNILQPEYGLLLFNTMLKHRSVLNIHGDIAKNEAANMRMFEVTGMGRCLITDWKPNLHLFFKDGEEVLSFKNSKECIEKIRWAKNNPEKANEIAKAGQRRTLACHNFYIRAKTIEETLKAYNLI